jgi:hypothetical protein
MFTGNKTIKQNGALVMGRGAAKEVRDSYPGIDKLIKCDQPVTFVKVPPKFPQLPEFALDQYLGYFCVKDHYAESADIALIEESVQLLTKHALRLKQVTFHLNYPGIGAGRLSIADVQWILEPLPDNVWVYQ